MSIGINTSIQNIYPGAISLQTEGARRQQDFNELSEQSENRADREKVRRVQGSSGLNSSFDQAGQGRKFQFEELRLKANASAGTDSRKTSPHADVLLQMIQRMGGAGVYNGPGQSVNILV